MGPFRRLIAAHLWLAVLVCAAALVLRIVVPAGYMVSGEGGRFAVTLCPGSAPMLGSTIAASTMAGMSHAMPHHGDPKPEQDHAGAPCAFAGLAVPSLGAVDPVVLAMALAIVAMLALRPRATARWAAILRLRPPLRGPPLYG